MLERLRFGTSDHKKCPAGVSFKYFLINLQSRVSIQPEDVNARSTGYLLDGPDVTNSESDWLSQSVHFSSFKRRPHCLFKRPREDFWEPSNIIAER